MLVVIVSLILNGTLWRLWGLYRDHDRLNQDIKNIQTENLQIDQRMKLVKDPTYIERQALDKLDLVDENDLIFVFAD